MVAPAVLGFVSGLKVMDEDLDLIIPAGCGTVGNRLLIVTVGKHINLWEWFNFTGYPFVWESVLTSHWGGGPYDSADVGTEYWTHLIDGTEGFVGDGTDHIVFPDDLLGSTPVGIIAVYVLTNAGLPVGVTEFPIGGYPSNDGDPPRMEPPWASSFPALGLSTIVGWVPQKPVSGGWDSLCYITGVPVNMDERVLHNAEPDFKCGLADVVLSNSEPFDPLPFFHPPSPETGQTIQDLLTVTVMVPPFEMSGWGRTPVLPIGFDANGLTGDQPYVTTEQSAPAPDIGVDGHLGYVSSAVNGFNEQRLGVGDNPTFAPWNFPQWGFMMRFRINHPGRMDTEGTRGVMLRWKREGQVIGPYLSFGDRTRHPGVGIDPNAVMPPSFESQHYQTPVPAGEWLLMRVWFSMVDCKVKVWREDDPLYEPRIWHVHGVAAKGFEEGDGLPVVPGDPPDPDAPVPLFEQSLGFVMHVGNGAGDPAQSFEVDWWGYYANEGAALVGRVDNELIGYGDSATSIFRTSAPYVAGTLRVTVSGIFVTPIDEAPETGEFMLDFPPSGGPPPMEVRASYQVAR